MSFLPPFIGTMSSFQGSVYGFPPVLPPVLGTPETPGEVGTDTSTAPYIEGPFCFGLDKLICQGLGKVHFGGARGSVMERMGLGTDLDLRDSCKRLMNALCGVLVLFVLLVVLAISIENLFK